MDADFVALSGDPFELSPEDWLDLRCELTVVAGEPAHAAGGIDLDAAGQGPARLRPGHGSASGGGEAG
jgi:hypothetical protein